MNELNSDIFNEIRPKTIKLDSNRCLNEKKKVVRIDW